jgi:putative membrane protein
MFHNWFWGGIGFSWLFWIAIIVLIFWLILNHGNKNREEYFPPKNESAIDILKKRYAKGEISHEEYEKIKKNLES